MNELLAILHNRFEKHMERHPNISWDAVEKRLIAEPEKVKVLQTMEDTGGEPDVIAYDKNHDVFIFCDCSAESPKGRRSLCYDHEALAKRKDHKPADSAVHLANQMGIELLDESSYRQLQTVGEFDKKTSSWIQTPREIRQLGGALFCDRRYNQVFVYHNGAESYYSSRGFRGMVRI